MLAPICAYAVVLLQDPGSGRRVDSGCPAVIVSEATPATSPAALTPLLQMRTLGSERGVLAVAGVDHRVVTEPSEELRLDIVEQ